MPDAVRDEGLHEDVGDCSGRRRPFRQTHVHTIRTLLDVVPGDGVREPLRRPATDRIVVIAMPRTAQPSVLDRPFPQRTALMRTAVVQRAQPRAAPGQRDATPVHHRGMYPPVVGYLCRVHLMPSV